MKLAVSIALAALGLAASGCATDTAYHPQPAAERPAGPQYNVPAGNRTHDDALSRITTLCRAVHKDESLPLECQVTQYKGYPTMLLSFTDVEAVETYSDAVIDRLAIPFCEALAGYQARLVLLVSDVQMVSAYACDTGKFSEWRYIARS
jgi:hypothetical protein